jgi:hypothetical protein
MSQKVPISKHSRRCGSAVSCCSMVMVGLASALSSDDGPGDEILCVHHQFTKLTSDSDVTSYIGP